PRPNLGSNGLQLSCRRGLWLDGESAGVLRLVEFVPADHSRPREWTGTEARNRPQLRGRSPLARFQWTLNRQYRALPNHPRRRPYPTAQSTVRTSRPPVLERL